MSDALLKKCTDELAHVGLRLSAVSFVWQHHHLFAAEARNGTTCHVQWSATALERDRLMAGRGLSASQTPHRPPATCPGLEAADADESTAAVGRGAHWPLVGLARTTSFENGALRAVTGEERWHMWAKLDCTATKDEFDECKCETQSGLDQHDCAISGLVASPHQLVCGPVQICGSNETPHPHFEFKRCILTSNSPQCISKPHCRA